MTKYDNDILINSYKEKIPLYQEFCDSMKSILIHLLNDKGFKYQISYRIKSIDSVKNKIIKKYDIGEEILTLDDLNDLAGIRIVFYLESEKDRFIKYLYNELTSTGLILKERHKEKGYRSVHVIAKFGEKRLNLCEYKQFKDLKCEIQLTSVLFHAWSEIEHDIIYKHDENLMESQKNIMMEIKKDLENTMLLHIQKASDKFESIFTRIRNMKVKN